MPGRFHELSVSTPDIGASIGFYESLGFWQAPTGDAWRHRYGVVTDGRVVVGLHETPDFGAITFIHPDLAAVAQSLDDAGVDLTLRQTDAEVFNQIEFADPAGQRVRMVAARTFSPADRSENRQSACGYFGHYSMPARDPAAVASFWEPLGFVALPEDEDPYPHLSLTSDGIVLGLHLPRLLPAPALVFCEMHMTEKISRLRAAGVKFEESLPRSFAPDDNALLEAPEGTLLLLLTGTL
jgi:catechol 2,3-dioxygenase-like lactoylglutathione lyase family enzyme